MQAVPSNVVGRRPGLHTWRSWFSAMSIHMRLVVDEEAIGQDFSPGTSHFLGTWWRNRLRHCATRRKVAGSIPDGVNRIFY